LRLDRLAVFRSGGRVYHRDMNYFAHGLPLIDDPYMLAGVSVPDWLNVVDRKVRARRKFAEPLADHPHSETRRLARGIVRHHDDDDWFHATAAFHQLQWDFTVLARDALREERGLRPSFLGHILIELLLDAALIEDDSQRLDDYYRALQAVSPEFVQLQIEHMTGRSVPRLAEFVGLFLQSRFLYDYRDDAKLLRRLNQVMHRVRLPSLPESFLGVLPEMRSAVYAKRFELLASGIRDQESGVRDQTLNE